MSVTPNRWRRWMTTTTTPATMTTMTPASRRVARQLAKVSNLEHLKRVHRRRCRLVNRRISTYPTYTRTTYGKFYITRHVLRMASARREGSGLGRSKPPDSNVSFRIMKYLCIAHDSNGFGCLTYIYDMHDGAYHTFVHKYYASNVSALLCSAGK